MADISKINGQVIKDATARNNHDALVREINDTIDAINESFEALSAAKNTAGATNSTSKLFLIGATSQTDNPQTYSRSTAYVGTDGKLYSGGKVVYASGDSFPEAYLSWGGRNSVGSFAPIDAAMIPALGANRLAFMPANGITVEYSQDGGTTWTAYSTNDEAKINLFNGNSATYYIGGSSATKIDKSKYMLRITIETSTAMVYTVLNKFAIYVSTNGSTGSYCTITGRTQANYSAGTDTWTTFVDKQAVSGWSGWNIINTNITTYGNQTSHYRQVRFTFGVTSHANTVTYAGLTVYKILGFGGVGWTTPSTLAGTGNIYSYDYSQNVTFPAGVKATSFTENGKALSDKYQAKGNYLTGITKDQVTTALGYTPPSTNTTYTFAGGTNSFTVTPSGGTAQTVTVTPSIAAASTSAAGLMSSADKTKLDGIATGANAYSLPLSASGTRGGIQIGYTASGANIPLQLSSEKAYVALTSSAVISALSYTPIKASDLSGYATKSENTANLTEAKSYTDTKIADLINGSPAALNTLDELAAALGDDPNFATTVSTKIGNNTSAITALQTAVAGKLEKTTYEKSAELACGSNGKVCLGKFGAYDTNITIELNSTTHETYHATIVIHSQNVVANGTGGTVGCYVYGDADNHVTPLISVFRPYGSASRQIEVYASLAGWSKNLVHVQAVALSDGGMTDILTSVSEIPTAITGKTKVTPVNVLTTAFLGKTAKAASATVAESANSVAWGNVTSKPSFATVATSGSYNDLTNKPTIPAAYTLPTRLQEGSTSGYNDANQATAQGWHYMSSTATNRPPFKQVDGQVGYDYRIMATAYSTSWLQQIATDFRSNDVFIRRNQNGAWQGWTALVKMQQGLASPVGTNNAIARWDSSRNATIKDSNVTIDDNGVLNAKTLQENGTALSSKYQPKIVITRYW